MAINKRLLVKPPSTGITPSEHFGVVLYEGDDASSHSINGGKFGAGAATNGSNSNLTYPEETFDINKSHTVSGWVNLSVLANEDMLFYNHDTNVRLNSNYSVKYRRNLVNTAYDIDSSTTLSANTWYHIVFTFSTTSGMTLYINGSSEGTDSYTGNASNHSSDYGLMYRADNGGQRTKGKIDQVRIFTKALSSSEVSTLYAETASTVESLDPLSEDTTDTLQVLSDSSCVATYRFENDETDLSGNFNGTGTAIQYAAGRYGQAGSFNGSSSNVDIGSFGSVFQQNFTVSLWFNLNSLSALNNLFSAQDDYYVYMMARNDTNKVQTSIQIAPSTAYAINSGTITTNTWYHAVITVSSTDGFKFYMNNVLQGTESAATGNLQTMSGNSFIGAYQSTTPGTFEYPTDGKIDQVRVFNKAISAAEVTTLYNENSLVASYRFEGNANDDMRTYDGTASNVTYEYGLGFTPDFIWIKGRTSADNNFIFDTTRGGSVTMNTNLQAPQYADTGVTSFDTGGFTLGSGAGENRNGDDYVAWCLKANGGTTTSGTGTGSISNVTHQLNSDAGFCITKFTVPNTSTGGSTTTHGLDSTPDFIIMKRITAVDQAWWVWHNSFTSGNDYLQLQENAIKGSSVNVWNGTAPDATKVTLGPWNLQGDDYIMYAFKNVDSFSKFGGYTGNGDANGPIIETGFEPAFIMVKRYNSISNWVIYDNKRNTTNPRFSYVLANESSAETGTAGVAAPQLDFLSNGFQPSGTEGYVNANGDNYIYMAFAADPDTEAPTVAKSFSTVTYTGNGGTQSITGLGFKPSLVWVKNRTDIVGNRIIDNIWGPNYYLETNTTAAKTGAGTAGLTSFDSDGFSLGSGNAHNGNNDALVAWAWKADDNEPTIFGGPAKAVYKFEDNANDVTGTYNATATNVTYSSSGKFNKAAEFNGSSSKIDLPNNPISTNLVGSVSLWVSGSSLTNTATSVNNILYNRNPYIGLDTYDGNLRLTVKDSSSSNTTISYATSNFNATDWYHIAYVFNGTSSTFELFVNGSSVGTATAPSSTYNAGATGYLGHGGGYQYFNGKIDQVRIYNGAIKQEQVDELYAETVSQNDDLELGGPPETIISANSNAGFSIVKWDGTGSAGKVPHGLSAAPEMIITKRLNGTGDWYTYHKDLNSGTNPAYNFIKLNSTAAEIVNASSGGSIWNSTSPSSTVINVGTTLSGSTSDSYIAYCFHSVSGYSKIGSYSGTGTTNSITGLGFQPDWLMIKRATGGSSNGWVICDSVRGVGVNLRADTDGAEADESAYTTSFDSDGFTLAQAGGNTNVSGSTYIYMAFKIN